MSRRRFLVPARELKEGLVALDPAEAAHAAKVLRLGPGDALELLDGAGGRGIGVLAQASRKEALARVERVERTPPPEPELTMLPGLLKGPAMDGVVAHFSELRVNAVRPVLMERSVPRPKDAAGKAERWQKLALQGIKQSGAAHAPLVHPPVGLAEALAQAPARALKLFLYEREAQAGLAGLLAARRPERPIWALVGPEGGVAPEEALALQEAGFAPVGLGPVILRAETANLALAALLRLG